MFFSVPAWAQEGAAKAPSTFEQLIPFVAIFAIFYFFIIRPQAKRQKTHASFLNDLKRGTEVITSGGIYGTVEGITDRFVTLEISDGVRIRILKSQIAGSAMEPTPAAAREKSKEKA
jgi:preprotein translocase subunit YajC